MNRRPFPRLALLARLGLLAMLALPVQALAQPPQPPPPPAPPPQPDVQQTHLPGDSVQAASPVAGVPTRISFDEAVKRAVAQNPSVLVAAANILSAQGLLRQARAAVLPNVAVTGTNVTLDDSRGLGDQVFTPQNTFSAGIGVAMPLFAPAQWAERVQALDAQHVAEASTEEVKRQIAVATAQAYLSVIAARRVVESQVRARDTAYAFYEYADNRLKAGAGSKLTALQAQLTVSADEALVEIARLALYRSQEALGVLVTEDVPVDAQDEPVFEIPEETATLSTVDQTVQLRTDIKLANLQVFAAQRIVSDSWKDWLPSVTGLFQPLFQDPSTVVSPRTSWRAVLSFGVPVFDAGSRRGAKEVRQASLQQSQAVLSGQVREARSEVRRAYESVRRSERVLLNSRAASQEASQVLDITTFSFRAGAATNLDVIDAQRRSRDADTAVAVAEDAVRQSRLDLLTALGRFP
jgi:outer membrane protein TolC